MRDWFFTQIWPILEKNQFAQGGLFLGIIGGVIAYFRALPQRFWRFIVRRTSVVLEVRSTDEFFDKLRRWFDDKQANFRYVRGFNTQHIHGKTYMIPGRGSHFMWYGWTPMRLSRTVDSGNFGQQVESYTIHLFFSKKARLHHLIAEIETFAREKQRKIPELKIAAGPGWDYHRLPMRTFESVILPGTQAQDVLEDMQRFWQTRMWYKDRCLPYRRGYLFYGIPGTGKTSFVIALARKMKLNVHLLNLAEMTDKDFREHMMGASKQSIILLEDVDAVNVTVTRMDDEEDEKPKKFKAKPGKLALMTLLNALDGLLAPEGVIVIMTSNHPEKLDAALIRPGRVDVRVPFTYATDEQLRRMYEQFNNGSSEDYYAWEQMLSRPIAMCAAQGKLIEARGIHTVGEEITLAS